MILWFQENLGECVWVVGGCRKSWQKSRNGNTNKMIKNKCKKCDILDSVLEQKIDTSGKTGETEKKKI